ncbi:MAG TPA: uracil-DNA glycosylase [Firmicutes bacterium]|nr:uracil-DNA glycosylase [Bacillota bacterium]
MVILNNDWDQLLEDEFQKDYYQKLRVFLIHEYRYYTVYPDMYEIFTALKLTSYAETKVVIIGQDPYHGPNQAHGLAFSVKPGVAIPPSLLNIFKELQSDLNCEIPDNGYLVPWAKQGVLLLNAVLTVRANQPKSHRNRGWEQFTDRVIAILNEKNAPIVFLLWGNDAKQKAQAITNPKHLILTATHPSPFSAAYGFFGCRHFSRANQFLEVNGLEPVEWQIPMIHRLGFERSQ